MADQLGNVLQGGIPVTAREQMLLAAPLVILVCVSQDADLRTEVDTANGDGSTGRSRKFLQGAEIAHLPLRAARSTAIRWSTTRSMASIPPALPESTTYLPCTISAGTPLMPKSRIRWSACFMRVFTAKDS